MVNSNALRILPGLKWASLMTLAAASCAQESLVRTENVPAGVLATPPGVRAVEVSAKSATGNPTFLRGALGRMAINDPSVAPAKALVPVLARVAISPSSKEVWARDPYSKLMDTWQAFGSPRQNEDMFRERGFSDVSTEYLELKGATMTRGKKPWKSTS